VTFRSSFCYLSRKLSAERGNCTTTDELCYNKLNAGSDRKDFILQVYILSKLLRPTWPTLVILHAHDAIQKYNAILNQMFTVQHCTMFSSLDLVPFSISFFRLARFPFLLVQLCLPRTLFFLVFSTFSPRRMSCVTSPDQSSHLRSPLCDLSSRRVTQCNKEDVWSVSCLVYNMGCIYVEESHQNGSRKQMSTVATVTQYKTNNAQ
jgi:hypothetical protein